MEARNIATDYELKIKDLQAQQNLLNTRLKMAQRQLDEAIDKADELNEQNKQLIIKYNYFKKQFDKLKGHLNISIVGICILFIYIIVKLIKV